MAVCISGMGLGFTTLVRVAVAAGDDGVIAGAGAIVGARAGTRAGTGLGSTVGAPLYAPPSGVER